ncbi:MAG TPA: hypothetical protein VFB34_12610 [Chloroflexota bacterium]|nr:hypothetical protein [Chloroflexota bacterium]
MPESEIGSDKLTDLDLYLFGEGTHARAYRSLGAHLHQEAGSRGTHFALWAPNASEVSVIGDFNGWRPAANPLRPVKDSGIWQGFVAGVGLEPSDPGV